jgi:3-dehydrosphinganine reductase
MASFLVALIVIFVLVILLLLYVYIVSKKVQSVQWNGAHVIITGGSSGIGLCVAILAVKRGSNVTIIARDQKKLEEAQKHLQQFKIFEVRRFEKHLIEEIREINLHTNFG